MVQKYNYPNCILILVMTLLLLGCADTEQKNYFIGVSQCSNDEWRTKMNTEMEREIAFHHGSRIQILSANDDSQRQIKDIQYFIDNNADLIIVSPNDIEKITPIISKAIGAGIPVIFIDRKINKDFNTTFIGGDNFAIGRMAGEYIASTLNHKGNIVEIEGLKDSSPVLERHNGFAEVMRKEPGINVVATINADWSSDKAEEKMDSVLNVHSDIDLVFAHNDRMAMAAAKSAERCQPQHDIKFVGIDAVAMPGAGVEAISKGILDASFIYPTGGDVVIEKAFNILEGKKVPANIILQTALVDKSNANVMLLQNKEMNHQDKRMEWLQDQVDEYWNKYSLQTGFLYACIIIIVLFIALLILMIRAYWSSHHKSLLLSQQAAKLEEQRDQVLKLSKEVENATQAKLSFFTNVSHDLRTPLTLIADSVHQIKDSERLNSSEATLMHIADKNVNVLMRLINQILDFRKYESGKLTLSLVNVDMRACLTEWIGSFRQLSINKHIHIDLSIEPDTDFTMAVDLEKMERIIFNLMSNAFKFTPANGTISIKMTAINKVMHLTISDSGIGMSAEYVSRIFESFYQVDETNHEGSGIGLTVVKSFIDLHNGTIEVESVKDKGSSFIMQFPMTMTEKNAESVSTLIPEEHVTDELAEIRDSSSQNIVLDESEDAKPLILIIDDNADIRTYLLTVLSDYYRVIQAADGQDGIRMASHYMPNLIVCDVMMPVMDGWQCCERLKSELQTSHIPTIMLTACSLDEQRIQSYNSGADAFLAKPFSAAMLLARIKSLLANSQRVREFFTDGSANAVVRDSSISDIDRDFSQRFKALIMQNISDSELSVEALGEKMGLSRVQLYRKIKTLTNYAPVELLRVMRLKQAYNLLTTTDLTISEVTYRVGFTTPSYFSKCYKEQFGELPTTTRSRITGA